MNPAVSVALACVGKFPARKLLWYIPAQYVGAWLGSAFVLMTYRDAIIEFYGGDDDRDWEMDTAGIFVTSPAKGISNVFAAIDQVFLSSMTLLFTLPLMQTVGTALLLLGVSAIGYSKNAEVSSKIGPLLVALTVVAIGVCFGHNAG